MNGMRTERRIRRSDDPMTALHYQLAFARQEAELEAIVLSDSSGCLVAGAGAWPVCEELAAFAPLIAHGTSAPEASRLAKLAEHAESHAFSIDGAEVFLCARGAAQSALMMRVAAGCRRILGDA